MKFDNYIPCDVLKPYIRSLAISETTEERIYKVLPDTGVVIGFQYSGKLAMLEKNSETSLSSSGVTGLRDTFRVFKSSANIGTILVFFREGGASPFFREPVHELFGESISLDTFMLRSELLVLEEQLCVSQNDGERIRLVEAFLAARLQEKRPDHLIMNAIGLINTSNGSIRIADLLKTLNISQSALEKRFRAVVGASPKKFASLVRLKHILKSYNPETSLTALGYEAGYYDQAHFIKEFKNFTGQAPSAFFLE